MTHDPRTKEEVYESLRDSLKGRITKLSNFTERSFNYVWTQAFSEEIRQLEIQATVAELAGWIDYAGGPITEEDLDELGIDDSVSPEEIEEYMDDEYLDNLVRVVGIQRLEGATANGTVDIVTQSSQTDIPEGTVVTTPPDSSGETLSFLTTEAVSTPNGITNVTDVSIEAQEKGTDYNVPADTIVRFASPPIGVRGVTNPEATTGGEERESNEELRARAKQAVQSSSLGGTTDGIKGYLRQNIDGVGQGDIIIDQFTNRQPPFVDVIVDGGDDAKVTDAINFSRPTGIRHNLIRPQNIQLGFQLDVRGVDTNKSELEQEMTDFLLEFGIGENFYEDNLIRRIMNSDGNIVNIDNIGGIIERVTNEQFIYDEEIDSSLSYDSGTTTYTDETKDANDDTREVTLVPSTPQVGDAHYFGEEDLFSKMDIVASTTSSGTGGDIVWEYSNGSSWNALNPTDNTNEFTSTGTNSVSWSIPTDWSQTVVDGNRNYYVRARVDSTANGVSNATATEINITESGYTLDYSYDNNSSNSTINIEDSSGNLYSSGTDFATKDKSGDGWPETIVWQSGGGTPSDDERFFVDYDVTVANETTGDKRYSTTLSRDEEFFWNENYTEEFIFDSGKDQYVLEYVPFDDTSSITADNSGTYKEGIDYDVISTGQREGSETFIFEGDGLYYLGVSVDPDSVVVTDDSGGTYQNITLVDTDGDGLKDALDLSSNTWDDGDVVSVEYKVDNGFAQTIDWSVVEIDSAVSYDEGSTTYTDETTNAQDDTPDDMTLLPDPVQQQDAYYFGMDKTFDDIFLNISTAGDGTWSITWEYYDGTNWVALSNVTDNTNGFTVGGINEISWSIPNDWSTTSIGNNPNNLYYIRARVDTSVSTSTTTAPLGQSVNPSSTPNENESFTITYDQRVFETKYELRDTPDAEIRDGGGTTYNEDTEYQIVDYKADNENDAIEWFTNPSSLGNGEDFYITYLTEGDLFFGDREKADPGTIDVDVV